MNSFKDKKIVVTGANGFIGAHLVAALESESAEVFALVRKHSDLSRLVKFNTRAKKITVDLLDYQAVRNEIAAIQPNYVFHTAVSRDYNNWQATLDMNSSATLNLLHACLSSSLERFVQCGSSLEYGDIKAPFRESDAIRPNSLFGASKAAGTLQLQRLALNKGFPVVILRLFHVYGILDNKHRLVPTAIKNFLSNSPVTLTDPGYRHDFVYVSDVVKACLLAATKKEASGQIFNIASGEPVANEDVIALIGSITGKQTEVKVGAFPPREWDKAEWYADISKAQKQLGWRPDSSLEHGLQQCVAWYLENER